MLSMSFGLEILANLYTNPYTQYLNDNDIPVKNNIFSDAAPSKTNISDMTGVRISGDHPTVFEPDNSMLFQHKLTPQGHTIQFKMQLQTRHTPSHQAVIAFANGKD